MTLTMAETEQSIIDDLNILGDGLSRMEFVLGCARESAGIPEGERREDELVADCQMNTWLSVRWEHGALSIRTDSESFLVKGALALISEIYDGRSREEVGAFSCRLLELECFSDLLNAEQKKGLKNVLRALKCGEKAERGAAT